VWQPADRGRDDRLALLVAVQPEPEGGSVQVPDAQVRAGAVALREPDDLPRLLVDGVERATCGYPADVGGRV
jgi:hypothetical protein